MEEKALNEFTKGSREFYEIVKHEQGGTDFRYIGILVYEKPCLHCHEQYGHKEGELSGGISVTMPAEPLINSQNSQIRFVGFAYCLIWLLGVSALLFLFAGLRKEEKNREEIIGELEEALGEVEQLSGLLPICCSCKKIRDDKGYWQVLEKYISEHSQAQFTHGICQECAEKLYPEIMKQREAAGKQDPAQDNSAEMRNS